MSLNSDNNEDNITQQIGPVLKKFNFDKVNYLDEDAVNNNPQPLSMNLITINFSIYYNFVKQIKLFFEELITALVDANYMYERPSPEYMENLLEKVRQRYGFEFIQVERVIDEFGPDLLFWMVTIPLRSFRNEIPSLIESVIHDVMISNRGRMEGFGATPRSVREISSPSRATLTIEGNTRDEQVSIQVNQSSIKLE
ncbi:uncharacterized protein KGF55_001217 [Candida pseudojiufengensis]|uniref:uncharacterized protein n=1 Tax=Candida pseudojiufengensis TaxID=497109 RepID=UPI0022256725|nr:uncharacterized protein KGF55_001217 [Candida pseudojiufengensis]KAI5965854.1 hypothetical protein KGF55_001217 [Candida pseudojiufengensis]